MPNLENTPADGQSATPPLKAETFLIHTSPEMEALERAAADGVYGRFYEQDEQAGYRIHKVPGSSHAVKLELSDSERLAGVQLDILKELTDEQDADSALAFLYISRLLAPPSPLEPNTAATGKIEFDDVIRKIGWDPRSTEERRQLHSRIYEFIKFAERAQVMGVRRGKYVDKHTGKEIDTEIRAAIWRIMSVEKPKQGSLYPELDVPVSVTLAVHPEWTMLLTSPKTAQYLPMGELLGAIPGSRARGAWARVIGLALASVWRRNPRECMDGTIRPTRKELLERYPPKTGTVDSILTSTEPQVAMDYWCGALKILAKTGFIEMTGDALLTPQQMRKNYPRKGWGVAWLNEKVDIVPGVLMRAVLTDRVKALPAQPVPSRKRGRPKKAQS